MTKNEFILQTMISMAANSANIKAGNFHSNPTQAKEIAKAAKLLADAAESIAEFDPNPQKP